MIDTRDTHCRMCSSEELAELGFLGSLLWFRCTCCGWEQPSSINIEDQ